MPSLLPPTGKTWFGSSASTSIPYVAGIETSILNGTRQLDIAHTYKRLDSYDTSAFPGNGDDGTSLQTLFNGGRMLFFNFAFKIGGVYPDGVNTWKQIAAGAHDTQLINIASKLKAWSAANGNAQVFISWEAEMDRRIGTSGNTDAEFATAWIHIHNVFVAQGARTAAVFVFAPTGYMTRPSQWNAEYPGDAYVDWLGYDPYGKVDPNTGPPDATAHDSYGEDESDAGADDTGIYRFYKWANGAGAKDFEDGLIYTKAGSHTKPIMVCETGLSYSASADAAYLSQYRQWWADLGTLFASGRYPLIQAYVFFPNIASYDPRLDVGSGSVASPSAGSILANFRTFAALNRLNASAAASRRAIVTWAEMAIVATRRARVTWAQMIVPFASSAPVVTKVLGPINTTAPALAGVATSGATLTITPGVWKDVTFAGKGSLAATAVVAGPLTRLHSFVASLSGHGSFAAAVAVPSAPPSPPPLPPSSIGIPNKAPSTSYLVEVAWGMSWATGGLFTFGTSLFGGSDVLAAAAFSSSFNVPYGDLTSRVRRISFVRGRDDLLANMQSGSLTVDLSDPDGLLNTRNTASPLHGTLYTGVPIRVSAYTSYGLLVPIYYGFVSTLTSDPGGRYGTAQLTATDLFTRLSRERPNLGALTLQTTGSLIANLLESIGWIDPDLLDLADGDALPDPYLRADGTRDVLTLVEEALQTERGYFFIAGDGTARYRSRYEILQSSPAASLDRVMAAAPVTLDDSRIRNRWTVTRAAMDDSVVGLPQIASADPVTDTSYRRYHYIDDAIASPMLVDDNQALALAQYLLSLTKDPAGVGWSVPINPSDPATLDQLILRDLGDRVRLSIAPLGWPSYTADYTIERIQTDITAQPGGPRHVTTWGVAEAATGRPFVFGTSTFGGPDILVY